MGYVHTFTYDNGQQVHQLYKKYSNSINSCITAINPNLSNTVHNWTTSITPAASVISQSKTSTKDICIVGLLVKDNNGSDSILVNSWQTQQFWKSDHDVYIPHRSDVSVNKHRQGNDEACCCLRLLV